MRRTARPAKRRSWPRHLLGLAALATTLGAALTITLASSAMASEPINGGGSTWSAVAIAQWQADVARQGLTVNYQSVGSTAGRLGYMDGEYAFAVSEIPFQAKYCSNPADSTTCYQELGTAQLAQHPYLYMPIVAGGTSLLYNLHINGQPFDALKLDVVTLTKIFTGQITNWDSPLIARDNPGVRFPNLSILPVVRSDGSGTSAQFTAYMANQDPRDYNVLCAKIHLPEPCRPTSQYPNLPGFHAQNGSDGVANFVAAPYNNGAIGYAESAYGREVGVPLASLRNAAGLYTQPTAVNVAVALTKAVIYADHTQNLLRVYTNPDPRTYPMSSYSYMIVPTSTHSPMDISEGTTLSKFILYFLCQGQQEAAPLGYSPLPPNLVQLGFSVEERIPGHVAPPPLSHCNNPTITGNFLKGIGSPTVTKQSGGTSPTSGTGAGGSTGGSTSTTIGSGSSGNTGTGGATTKHHKKTKLASGGGASGGGGSGGSTTVAVVAKPTNFGSSWEPLGPWVSGAAALVVALVIFGPTLFVFGRRSWDAGLAWARRSRG